MSRGINSTAGYAIYREWCKISVIPTFKLKVRQFCRDNGSISRQDWRYCRSKTKM